MADDNKDSYDVVVIGAGIGGLSAGALLAKKGLSVAVFESHKKPGGYCTGFRRSGYTFDACLDAVSGCAEGGWLRKVLEKLGVQDEVELIRLDPLRVDRFGEDTITVPAGLPALLDLLCGIAPGEKEGVKSLLRTMEDIHGEAMATPPEALYGGHGTVRGGAAAKYLGRTYNELLDEFVKDELVRAVMSDRCAFMGLPPSRVSAVAMAVMFMTYATGGGYRIKDGSQRLADAMAKGLKDAGGEVFYRSPVTGILSEGGRVTGVEVAGRKVKARAVVSAGDWSSAAGMAGIAVLPHGLMPSVSFFMVYLGLNGVFDVPDSMGVYPGCDIESTFRDVGSDIVSPNASMEIINFSRISPSMAPAGGTTLMLMSKAAHGYRVPWHDCKQDEMERAIDFAARAVPGIRDAIVHAEAATPCTLARYTRNTDGAAFGWEQGAGNPRPGVRAGLGGLYLAGHWTYPGGGVESVAASGIIAAETAAAGL